LKYCAVIATHHKTGTIWMRAVFRAIGKHLSVNYMQRAKLTNLSGESVTVPSIVFDQHSRFPNCQWILKHPKCRVFHLIRDPRDVIVSGAHYHCTADEPGLHEPREEFDGLTYQQKINSLPDDQSRYLFEMQHTAKSTIKQMGNWDYTNPNSFECRYEELVRDKNVTTFRRALRHLGFEDNELEECCTIFAENSLFAKNAKAKRGHVRSGDPEQWRKAFSPELAERFLATFGDILVNLGYERDNSWTADLPSGGRVLT
jgi:hypothetical protein